MITATMKRLVKAEAKNLKKYATKEELAKLDAGTFNPIYEENCIYGQITGDCKSERAATLIQMCCDRVYKGVHDKAVNEIPLKLNGKPTGEVRITGHFYYFSPIEMFIARVTPEENFKLIRYLRGETKTLNI